MSLPDQTPKLPKLPFLIGDAILIAAAWFIYDQSRGRLSASEIYAITACVGIGAILAAIPFLSDYARKQDEALDERQRGLEALSRTVNTAAEQISIAANGLNEITEVAHRNVKQAEQLPQKLQEKIAEFKAQLENAREDDREEMEKELAELRASESERLQAATEKIHKDVAELTKLDAAVQKHLTARTELLEHAGEALAKAKADSSAALNEVVAAVTREIDAAQAKALAAIDAKFAEQTAAAVAAIGAAAASAAQLIAASAPAAPAAPAPAPVPVPAAAEATAPAAPSSEIASPPKRPRKSRREEMSPAETTAVSPTESSAPTAEPAPASEAAVPMATAPAPEPAPEPAAAPAPEVPSSEPASASSPAIETDTPPPAAEPEPSPSPITEPPAAVEPVAATPAAEPTAPPAQSEPAPAAPEAAPAEPAATERPARKRAPRKSATEPHPELLLDLASEGFGGTSSDDAALSESEVVERVISSDGATRLIVTAYIGIGNRVFIRGEGPGLAWDKGVPLQFVSIGKWRWETMDATAPVSFKLYKNDETECALGTLSLDPGHQQEVTAKF